MRIGIYGGVDCGCVHDRSIAYIGVDRGVEFLIQQGIHPILAIGDMDSLQDHSFLQQLNIKTYPCQKDDTDTALALDYALTHGYHHIDLYGVTKKRQDHFMAVLCLLRKYRDNDICIYDEYNKIYLLKAGHHHILKDDYQYFSLFALKDTDVTLKGCHYPLNHYLLKPDDPLCVSNEMDDMLDIEISEDVLFFQTR